MRIKHELGAASLSHEGQTFEADEHGYIDAPFELANLLLNQTEWSIEEAVAVGSSDPHSALFVAATEAAEEVEAAAAAKALEDAEASQAAEAEAAAAEAKAAESADKAAEAAKAEAEEKPLTNAQKVAQKVAAAKAAAAKK